MRVSIEQVEGLKELEEKVGYRLRGPREPHLPNGTYIKL